MDLEIVSNQWRWKQKMAASKAWNREKIAIRQVIKEAGEAKWKAFVKIRKTLLAAGHPVQDAYRGARDAVLGAEKQGIQW